MGTFALPLTPCNSVLTLAPNGSRYPLGVGGWIRPRNGTPPKPDKCLKNAGPTPSRVHAVLGAFYFLAAFFAARSSLALLKRAVKILCMSPVSKNFFVQSSKKVISLE